MLKIQESFLSKQQSVYSKTLLGKEDDESNDDTVRQLLSHVPNSLIYFDYKQDMPATKEFLGVVLFADISGFTKLTECYSTMETSDGTSGTDKLSATLNAYIGKIVEEIIQQDGDILKFAGDAILATWKCSDIGHNAKSLLNRVINCSIDIQKKCDNFLTEVGIVLCVKLAIAVGPMCLTYVGLPSEKQFDLSGAAVDDVGDTEKQATPGAIILSQLAWANCDQSLFSVTSLEDGEFFKIIGHSQITSKGSNTTNQTQKTTALFQQLQKSVTSPLDEFIDQVGDYTQDMPKALLLDEEEKITTGFMTQTVIAAGKQKKEKKKKKFDRLTMTSDLKKSEIDNLRAYVAKPVLDKLDNGQNLEWLSEMRQVSVLFINMKLPDPAGEASEALQKAFEVVHESCVKFKGNLNKLFGFDKGCTFVVIFGLPGQKHEDDPVRALKCGLEIFDSLHSVQEIINESIGVTTGLAFTGVVGHKDRHEYTVIGSKVNMAARLMMYYPGLLTCDVDTYEQSKSRLRKQDFVVMPFIELKGMKDPGIVREYNPNSSKKEDEEDFYLPIIGRKKELEKATEMFMRFDQLETSQTMVMEGEAGIGKTRLLEQIMDEAEKQHLRIIHVEGDLAHAQNSGHITNVIVKLLFEQDPRDKEKLLALIKNDENIMENIHLLRDVLGILNLGSLQEKRSIERNDAELYLQRKNILMKVINLVNQIQPCLFAIDNARYVDERSWTFLQQLNENIKAIFVFSIRTVSTVSANLSTAAIKVLRNEEAIMLNPTGLEKELVTDFICQLLEVCEVPKKLCELIQVKSQGVPSWCEQLIKDALYGSTIQIVSKASVLPSSKLRNKPGGEGGANENKTTEGTTGGNRSRRQSGVNYEFLKSVLAPPNLDENMFAYNRHDYVQVSPGVLPYESDEICIISPDADLKSILVPNSVKDMVLARMDRMSQNEQTVLKCAAVLGQSFTRDLLKAIIPRTCVNMLDTTLYNLSKQQFFECGSIFLHSSQQRSQSSHTMMTAQANQSNTTTAITAHHYHHHTGGQGIHNFQVLCACYTYDGFPIINLSQSNNFTDRKKRVCLYFQFCNTFVQEAAYALWLEDQRKALMEKAATHLERFSDKCRACGGNGFIPGHGKAMSATEHVKCGSGRRFSMAATGNTTSRSNRVFSNMFPDQPGGIENSSLASIQEEATRVLKYCKSDHIKNYTIKGTKGEQVGLLLIELSKALAETKESTSSKPSRKQQKFGGKSSLRNHSNPTVAKLATRTLLMEFRKSSLSNANENMAQQSITDSCDVDLSQCQCSELRASILPQLVFYWRSSGSILKAFHYMIEATSAAIHVNDTMKTPSLLRDLDELMEKHEKDEMDDFIITDEEKAKIECLKGQALCNMGCLNDGIAHFHNALRLLKAPQPGNKLSLVSRMCKASLVQTLHLNMPGVFMENKRDGHDVSIEQIHCLFYLSKAYTMKKEYNKAYLTNLEQLNAAEEAPSNCWNELMNAYSNMIISCLVYRKFSTGKSYEKIALDMAKTASLKMEDMVTLGKMHLTLVSFHLGDQNVNRALEAAMRCHKVARSINDLNLKICIIPLLVQIHLLKFRSQSCNEVLLEFKALIQSLDDEKIKATYYNCCMDQFLYTGDMVADISEIIQFVTSTAQTEDNFFINRLRLSLALWFARQSDNALPPEYWEYVEIPTRCGQTDVENEIFYVGFLVYHAECALHQYRCHPNVNGKMVKHCLGKLQDNVKSYGIFQPRLLHYQAYYSYLRNKTNRAKLTLVDCKVASKNQKITYDLEWSMSDRRVWFPDETDNTDVETQLSGGLIKYNLPRV